VILGVAKMTDLSLQGKRVLIREDFNVPIKDGIISSDARILAALPTIVYALEAGAKVILMSHLGRPTEGVFDQQYSIKPVAEHLKKLLKVKVKIVPNWQEKTHCGDCEISMLENVRFNQGENTNNGLTLLFVIFLLWTHLVLHIDLRPQLMVWQSMRQLRVRAHYWFVN
jgi:phosphoglycerate kinase